MESELGHRVLIVDDEAQVAKSISRILEMEKIETVAAISGSEGLEKIKTAPRPFSLIIADQRMPGMKGTQFLEEAKNISPDTVRFLITGYSQMETILHAVNRGAVQKYITKPWDPDELLSTIQSGIQLYEQLQENEKLLALAKRQNKQLYELNCELMELTKDHNKKLKVLDAEIELLKEKNGRGEGKESGEKEEKGLDLLAQEVEKALGETPDQDALDTLFFHTVEKLFHDFNDLAQRNGFEMPEPMPKDWENSLANGVNHDDLTQETPKSEGLNPDE